VAAFAGHFVVGAQLSAQAVQILSAIDGKQWAQSVHLGAQNIILCSIFLSEFFNKHDFSVLLSFFKAAGIAGIFSAVSALIIENSTRNVNQIEKKIGNLWIFYTNLPGMTVCRRV
jgi:hypothetical protein